MEDPRFTRVAQDPRFKKISRKERKLKIDGRFEKMFTDKSFTTKYFVDKRGSRVEKTSTEDLHRFYEMSDESDKEDEVEEFQPKEKERREITEKKVAKSKSKKEKAVKKDGRKMKKKLQLLENDDNKGVGKKSSKNIRSKKEDEDENGSSSEEDIDLSRGEGDVQSSSEEEDEGQLKLKIKDDEIEHPWGEMDVSTKTTKDSTRRLAVCNLDWDRVTATDLFVLFNSFKPRDGVIKSVKIYPSDYGLEQMQKEECLGPVELKDDEGGSENLNENGNTEGSGFSMEKLRQYQLNRLKYYYAVMDCDSPGTAEVLYDECDGTEFELSGNILDLRYIPDDMEFDHEPHSVATGIPASGTYSAPEFSTTALHQTNVKLTWDETDPGRQRATMRKFKKEDLLEMDFNAYLASSSDEEDEHDGDQKMNEDHEFSDDEDKKIDKYKQLLREIEEKDCEADREQEIEITWEPGLQEATEGLVTNKMKEKERKEMTPWETYLQNKKDKRKEKQTRKDASNKQISEKEPDESYESFTDVDVSDPFFSQEIDFGLTKGDKASAKTKKNRKRARKETEEDKKAKEELELLLMEDKDDRQHFSLKGIMDSEKRKSKKRRKRKANQEEIVDDNFNVNLKDSRFDALFTSHHFAVDPSDPQYRKTKAMETIIEERQRRRETEGKTDQAKSVEGDQSQRKDPSLSLLVKSVKSKTGQFYEQKKKKRLKQ
ncbi:ESF1 homolog [Porites lutea]|uniref:ESF1 homolog n=1 Tax=Porites lutea TaxID=51062 RepID=UPI003CC68F7F